MLYGFDSLLSHWERAASTTCIQWFASKQPPDTDNSVAREGGKVIYNGNHSVQIGTLALEVSHGYQKPAIMISGVSMISKTHQ